MSFCLLLSPKDRDRLRAIVRKTHAGYADRRSMPLDDRQCDQLIDAMAPNLVQGMIKTAVDSGAID